VLCTLMHSKAYQCFRGIYFLHLSTYVSYTLKLVRGGAVC